jgi:hypothetical protein
MDLIQAMEIMEIESDEVTKLTLGTLKKKYHKLALLNHPDKNGNSVEATEKFKEIGVAYEVLKRELVLLNPLDEDKTQSQSPPQMNAAYSSVLNMFLESILQGKYNEFILSTIKDIVLGVKEISIKMFDKLDRETTLVIYDFIFKYKNILHVSESILSLLREIILEKFKDIQIYTLNPSIDDLIENNIYKLEINKTLYFVPLWHGELYFDANIEDKTNSEERNSEKVLSHNEYDIIVKCIPDLPPHMNIDENNNLYVNINIPFQASLLKEKSIPIYLGKKRFDIEIERLFIKEKQTYVFKKMGISLINENDMYNIERKGDVYVKITFV